MEQKKTLLIVVLVLALLLVVAYPMYNRLSRTGAGDQLMTLPQQNNSVSTQPSNTEQTQSPQTQPTDTRETQPEDTQETKPQQTQPQETTPTIYDFTAYDGDGNPVKLSDYVGKPIVLNFWASWCGPCKSEMPEFQQTYTEMGQQVQFLMVNATVSDTLSDAKSFISRYGYTFPVLFDTTGEALTVYGVDAFPTTFFLSKTGEVVGYAVGAITKDTLLKGIEMITK